MSGWEWGVARYRDGRRVSWTWDNDNPWTEARARNQLQLERDYERDPTVTLGLIRRPTGEWEDVDD